MRTEQLMISVTPEQKAAITALADGYKVSVSALLYYGFELAQEVAPPADLDLLSTTLSKEMADTIQRLDEANAAIEETLRATRGNTLAAE